MIATCALTSFCSLLATQWSFLIIHCTNLHHTDCITTEAALPALALHDRTAVSLLGSTTNAPTALQSMYMSFGNSAYFTTLYLANTIAGNDARLQALQAYIMHCVELLLYIAARLCLNYDVSGVWMDICVTHD